MERFAALRKTFTREEGRGVMLKPDKCCDLGTYDHQVCMPIMGRVCGIDYCISHIVAALNAGGVETVASCCGHGKMPSIISLDDGRQLAIFDNLAEWESYCINKGGTNDNP